MGYDQIPSYFKWLYDLSFFQFSLGILQINQFGGISFTDCGGNSFKLPSHNDTCYSFDTSVLAIVEAQDPAIATECASALLTCYKTGDDFLNADNIDPDSIPTKFGYLGIYFAASIILGFIQIRRAVQAS